MPKKTKEVVVKDTAKNVNPVVASADKTEENIPVASEPVMNFIYSITNDGKQIQKKFEGDANPQDVIMTLFSCMIGDIKTNIQPDAYEEILNYLVLQYKALLLPTQVANAE